MKRELEALLFATDSPLTIARLRKIFPEAETADLRAAVKELQDEYDAHDHAFTVIEFGGGYQIATKPEFSPTVEKMLKTRRFARLSKAGLEVLAIVAYKQPLTRVEIDEIRGVNSSGAISTLTERNLITVVGRSQTVGNPLLYGTTREFLNHLGLKGLGELPDLPEIEQVVDDKEELREFATRVGRDVTDEELEDYFAAPEADAGQAVDEVPSGSRPEEMGPEDTESPEAAAESGQDDGNAADEDGARTPAARENAE